MVQNTRRGPQALGSLAAGLIAIGGCALLGVTPVKPSVVRAAESTSAGSIAVRMGSVSVAEGSGTRANTTTLDVRLSTARSTPSCVWWHTETWSWSPSRAQGAGGALKQTAFDGSQDYMTLGDPTPRVTRIAGGSSGGRLPVRIFPDNVVESEEAFIVKIDKITAPEGSTCTGTAPSDPAFIVAQRRGVVTIVDDDAAQPMTVPIAMSHTATAATVLDDALWAIGGTSITEIDPVTNTTVRTLDLGIRLRAIAAGAGSLWVSAGGDDYGEVGEVLRINPVLLTVSATIPVATEIQWGAPTSMAFAGGKVFFAQGGSTTMVVRAIDPATNAVSPGTAPTSSESGDFYDDIRLGYISQLVSTGDSLLILNSGGGWVLNPATGIPWSRLGFCADRAFNYGYGGGVAHFGYDASTSQLFASCQAGRPWYQPDDQADDFRLGYITHAQVQCCGTTQWPERIDIDTTLVGPAAGQMAVLDDEIWAAGADSTLIRMQPRRIGNANVYIGQTSTAIPIPAGLGGPVVAAFGSVWAFGDSSVTRVVV